MLTVIFRVHRYFAICLKNDVEFGNEHFFKITCKMIFHVLQISICCELKFMSPFILCILCITYALKDLI